MKRVIRLGTRGSALALLQANEVKSLLLPTVESLLRAEIEIVPITTSGDWRPEHQERRFVEMGGNKGMFTKEVEDALLSNYIDFAVHSMKDVASIMPDGLTIAAMLPRVDPRDAFISSMARTLDDLPQGASVGTASLRRQAQILARRPDLRVTALRGNVDTRLKKLQEGFADATLLAVAGLHRLGLDEKITSIMDTNIMLPASGQGALGVQCRADDKELRAVIASINHSPTMACVDAERAVVAVIDGTCHTPAGAYAQIGSDGHLHIDAMVARPDGSEIIRLQSSGALTDAQNMGKTLGQEMKSRMPPDFLI